ncbi:MAG: rhodanese-like domain-containing protein [Bacteroidota bacterium]
MKAFGIPFVLVLMVCACGEKGPIEIQVIDKLQMQEKVIGKDVQLVDVRTQEEYESGHIEDAINFNIINNETFLDQIETLDKEEPVYLYCKMGGRSNRAAQLLKDLGFTEIYDYSGGYNDWVVD